jgi:hypothetical protein
MSHLQWPMPVHWFGVTLGSSIWLVISGAVLLAQGHRSWAACSSRRSRSLLRLGVWARRARSSAYCAWQGWLIGMWVAGLMATAITHVTGSHTALNLDASSVLYLYAGIGIGVPLLIADGYCRERSAGRRGVFGALFDLLASLV